jgi:hypothetical protein
MKNTVLLFLIQTVFFSALLSAAAIDRDLHFFDQKDKVIRYGEFMPGKTALQKGLLKKGDRIEMRLFEDVHISAVVSRSEKNINGTETVTAGIEGSEFGYVISTTTGERSLINVKIPEKDRLYQIISNPSGLVHYVLELQYSKLDILQNSHALIPDQSGRPAGENDNGNVKDSKAFANIDVMIVYTPAAKDWADTNGGGIANVVAQAVASGQLALANTNIEMDITLVHSAEVSYTESGSANTDLNRFTFHEGYDPWSYEGTPRYMDEIHDWRDAYGADICAIFTLENNTGGLGWTLNDRYGWAEIAFNLNRVQQVGWTFTFIHEAGHNMGTHHHKQQNTQPGPTSWYNWSENTWSAGWRWVGTGGNMYCDLMTYNSGTYFADGIDAARVAVFSNPNVYMEGGDTGHSADGDNSRTLNEVKQYIAAYRTAPSPDIPHNVTINESSGSVTVSWDQSNNANSYIIYHSDDPYTGWVEVDTTADLSWIAPIGTNIKKFYRIVASSESVK